MMCEEVTESFETIYETNDVNFTLAEIEDTTDVCPHYYYCKIVQFILLLYYYY